MVTLSRRARSSSSVTRRSHHKSRNGCVQCKSRHIKCDENHPSCVNCSTIDRKCSFSDQPRVPRIEVSTPTESPSLSRGPTPATTASPYSAASSPASLGAVIRAAISEEAGGGSGGFQTEDLPSDGYDLAHLGLLHHLETEMLKHDDAALFLPNREYQTASVDTLIRTAMSEMYLMDELLALSALHLSTLAPDAAEKQRCCHQAAQLQTRALTRFNMARPAVNEDNCTAMFLFAGLLGLHTLFDATSFHSDFSQFLDKLIHFLSLHRGVRAVTRQSWHIISKTEIRHIVDPMSDVDAMDPSLVEPAATECDVLMDHLVASSDSLGSMAFNACREAVQWLQWVTKQRRTLRRPLQTHVTLAWPVLIPFDFLQMLRQRRPEALVILAHWAVFLHYDREFWVFSDSGRVLIESTSKYLGSYWDDWMAWPNEVLEAT